MKKLTRILIGLLIIGLLLTGCSTAPVPEAESAPETAPNAAPQPTVGEEFEGLDTLDEDLDLSDLDSLEEELNFG